MPIGRVFGDLSVFDLLGNFVPGIILMTSIFLLLPGKRVHQISTSPLVAVFVLGVIAFALGHLIQSYAAQAVGQRETFRNSIFLHQSLGTSPILNFEEHPTTHPHLYFIYSKLHPDEPEEWNLGEALSTEYHSENKSSSIEDEIPTSESISTKSRRIPARIYRSLIEAIAMVRIKRDRPLSDLTIAGKAWNICRAKYDLDSNYSEYGDLLHLMSSDIESHAPSSRAFRFQALRNFQRGMWIACYFSFLLMMLAGFAQLFSEIVTALFAKFGLQVWQPVIVDLWTPIWMLCLAYVLFMYLFWELKEDYEEEFVEYLLTDFLAANTDRDQDSDNDNGYPEPETPSKWYQ